MIYTDSFGSSSSYSNDHCSSRNFHDDENEEYIDLNVSGSYSFNSNNDSHNNGRMRPYEELKTSARGHWKPTEDAKLKELVSIYGPQNWNLIAEKLEGRSGIF